MRMPYADPERQRAYFRAYLWEWKRSAKGRFSQQCTDAARHANERAMRYGAAGRISGLDARSVLEGAVCVYCGTTRMLGLDHVVPLAHGGANLRGNLVPACRSCNSSKFRSDRPHRWSRLHDCCFACGRQDRPHGGRGFCRACYQAVRKQERLSSIPTVPTVSVGGCAPTDSSGGA